jgi:hypothetical protein
MNTLNYKVRGLSVDEYIALRVAIKQSICQCFRWRNDGASWREQTRHAISAYRKLVNTREVEI